MATQYPDDNRHEYGDLLRKIAQLEQRNGELVVDLMRDSAKLSEAEEKLKRWRTELEIVAEQKGHNLCHTWIPNLLKNTLGYTGNFPDPGRMTKTEFKMGCKFYQDDIFGPDTVPLCSGEMFKRKAVFLDRDGTLIKAVHRPNFPENSPDKKEITAPFKEDELIFVPHVLEALGMLKRAGFLRIMVTNQPDVAHGYMDEGEWQRIQGTIVDTLDLDDVFMCRHRQEDNCPFKKPSALMLQSAADKWGIDLSKSFMVGDTDADMKTGKLAGCGTVLVNTFYNSDVESDVRTTNLLVAAKVILFSQKVD